MTFVVKWIGYTYQYQQGKQTFSKFCKECAICKNKQNDPQYDSWLTEHVCKIKS